MISYGDRDKRMFERWTDWRRQLRAPSWVPMLMYAGVIIMALLLSMQAKAGEATLSWTAPTQNTDGTALTDLAGFKIYAGLVQGGPYGDVSITINNPTTTTFVVPGLAEGTTYFFVTTAFNSADPVQESDFSNEVSKLIPPLVPMPPTMLTVQNLLVWDVLKEDDHFKFLGVGTVPGGTTCDPTQTVNGRYVVPNDLVEWFGNVQPPVVVADCS